MSTLNNNEVDSWIESLYAGNDSTFTVEFAGKSLVFKKRFPTKIAFQMQGLKQEQQMYCLIAMLSVQPVITEAQAAKLPQDFLMEFAVKVKEFFDPDTLKKKLAPTHP